MPLTLGEKLRQAREERGISISEVAEQTRISPHYLECIENNDFKTLPGGIFNKGFIKSFARYVGVNEAEAVQDYILALGEVEGEDPDAPKAYHPEVLTDDRTASSMAPTIVFAVIILALMTAGILFVVRYLLSPSAAANQASASTPALVNSIVNSNPANANATVPPTSGDKISVELKAVSEPVWVSYSVDGVPKIQTLAPDESVRLDAANSFKISYSKAKLPNLQVSVNGRQITPPSADNKGKVEFEVNKANVNTFLQGGQAVNPATPAATPAPTEKPAEPKHSPSPEKTKTPKPSVPGVTSPSPKPSPTVIVIGPQRPRTAPSNRPN
jgi:cytoskeleton protein RodZ